MAVSESHSGIALPFSGVESVDSGFGADVVAGCGAEGCGAIPVVEVCGGDDWRVGSDVGVVTGAGSADVGGRVDSSSEARGLVVCSGVVRVVACSRVGASVVGRSTPARCVVARSVAGFAAALERGVRRGAGVVFGKTIVGAAGTGIAVASGFACVPGVWRRSRPRTGAAGSVCAAAGVGGGGQDGHGGEQGGQRPAIGRHRRNPLRAVVAALWAGGG
ncbi:hypothetical protein NHF48_018435 [Sphingomonas sp. H160509]|uniref:hypothetical protein n=1 Tax=Sphingomonas sp. H160509 TaxID=2955313 RepID=UPI0020982308|nr:hypothetical protein [Sphingomonas sp. H160509]MDD1452452.1 hypothetical protein [Sphingomonas sp. H160509]